MSGLTNKGKMRILGVTFRGDTPPTNFYVALCTSAVAPDKDLNTKSQMTEIAAGNGYTAGGYQVDRNSTDFDTLTEDDATDRGYIRLKNLTWTASSGPIPSSGNGARYAILTDDNVTLDDREVWAYWDLGADYSISDGQTFTLQDAELRLDEPV